MSEIQKRHYKICSRVFKEAWSLRRRTILFNLNMGTALKLAWRTVRSLVFMRYSKAYGTTFHGRQLLLRRLSQYDDKDIFLTFEREPQNEHDSNAIKIIAHVKNKGVATIGYVSRDLAAKLAPLVDLGYVPVVLFAGITGINSSGFIGCNFKYCLIKK